MTTLSISPYSFSVQSSNRGESNAAKSLDEIFKITKAHITASRVMKQSTFGALAEVFSECQGEAWDGYSARPLSSSSFRNATKFLDILPSWVPVPEIAPEPDGEIALEWRRGESILSISVGADGTITYAGLFGSKSKIRGTEPFDDSIPPVVLESIRRLNKV